MDSVGVDYGSLIFLRQAHDLRFNSFSKIQRSILLYPELIEVSTSLGRTQPLSTEASAMNSPFLLKIRARRPEQTPRISFPCITLPSSGPDTSILGHEMRRRSIGTRSVSLIRAGVVASAIRKSPERVRRSAVKCAPHPTSCPKSWARLRT